MISKLNMKFTKLQHNYLSKDNDDHKLKHNDCINYNVLISKVFISKFFDIIPYNLGIYFKNQFNFCFFLRIIFQNFIIYSQDLSTMKIKIKLSLLSK